MRGSPVLALLLAFPVACLGPGASEPERPRRELAVAFVVVDGVYQTELVAPFDVFHHTIFVSVRAGLTVGR
jgi:hypothetical protein